jgi:anti-sigma28 factor (negative regulator of flagellin synthesis)
MSRIRGTDGAQAGSPSDVVEISEIAIYLEKLSHVPDIRQEKVDPVQAEIDRGTYETEEKVDYTVDQIMTEL